MLLIGAGMLKIETTNASKTTLVRRRRGVSKRCWIRLAPGSGRGHVRTRATHERERIAQNPIYTAVLVVKRQPAFAVPYVDLPALYMEQREEILAAVDETFAEGDFILRPQVAEFERELGHYLSVRHCVGVNSGTDALYLSLEALGIGPGDEVITAAHTFVASIAAIARRGATPVLVDVGADGNVEPENVASAITARTRAMLVVHMNGRCCEMDALVALCEGRDILLVEDAAQAMGATYRCRCAGQFGVAAGFSLHPMKVLSVGGDGGFITCEGDWLAAKLRALRNHGQVEGVVREYGVSSRLDTLHAVVGRIRLRELNRWIARRREIAGHYQRAVGGVGDLQLPPAPQDGGRRDVYSSYIIRSARRDALVDHLLRRGIETAVFWRDPVYRQLGWSTSAKFPGTEALSRESLALPVHAQLCDEQVETVCSALREFFGERA